MAAAGWLAGWLAVRNGADYSVFINTGQEFDGSDSGARPDEAVSWGKIRLGPQDHSREHASTRAPFVLSLPGCSVPFVAAAEETPDSCVDCAVVPSSSTD